MKRFLIPLLAAVAIPTNVNANLETNVEKIKELLVKQIYSRVRWRESIIKAADNNPRIIIELGSGKILTGINKRIGIECDITNISNTKDLEMFIDNYADFL